MTKEKLLTFNAEGSSDPKSPYYSRRLHVPSPTSGATLGRGFDMKEREASKVIALLILCGVDTDDAVEIAKLCGLSGDHAKTMINSLDLQSFEVTAEQEEKLFLICYDEKDDDFDRIVSKPDVVKAYGKTHLAALHSKIRAVCIDLLYRGDFTGTTRKSLMPAIVANDVIGFAVAMSNRVLWASVPADRFKRRVQFLGGH